MTVDIDVLDPAFVPGTGTPEPGGLSSAELLLGAREVAARAEVVGADLVEVIPTAIGTADRLGAGGGEDRREILTGIAMRRLGVAAAG